MSLSTTEVQLVYDGGTVIVPGPMGEPAPNQMKGTEPERLSEVASRICYDSLGVNPETGKPRGRSSELLHAHILEVGHTSVYEHPNFTVRITDYSTTEHKLHEYYRALINRKGVWLEIGPSWLDVTLNLRTVLDWDKHSTPTNDSKYTHRVEFAVKSVAHSLAPMVVRHPGKMIVMGWNFDLVKSEDLNAHQAWVSLYMRGSRGFSHEQVRHGDETGVSQRSTRYVDEDQSPYTDHPLIATYCNDPGVPRSSRAETIQSLANTRRMCSLVYENTVDKLFKFLVYRGVPKDIARKQSRGAARSYLGNGLETELIFSGSCAQWRHMIEMRGSIHADQEIREVYAKVLPVLKGSAHGRFFSDMELVQSPDGIGHVVQIGAAA